MDLWQETCAQYWPSVGDSRVFDEFVVEIQNEVEYPGFFERTLEKVMSNLPCAHRYFIVLIFDEFFCVLSLLLTFSIIVQFYVINM